MSLNSYRHINYALTNCELVFNLTVELNLYKKTAIAFTRRQFYMLIIYLLNCYCFTSFNLSFCVPCSTSTK